MSNDLNPEDQFLLGGGGQSAQFKNIGDYVDGIITATQVTQQTDLESGEALWWDPEKTRPRQQLVVTLQTELRDPEVEDDDGIRKVYVKGSTKAGSRSLHDACAQAVRAAGAKGLKVGGWARFHFVEEEPATKKGLSPRKLWQVTYRAPDGEAESGALLGTAPAAAPAYVPPAPAPAPAPAYVPPAPAPAPAYVPPTPAPAPAPAPAPVAAPPAAPAAAAPSPVDSARAMIAAGVDDAVILAALPGLQPVVLQALRNAPA